MKALYRRVMQLKQDTMALADQVKKLERKLK